MCTALLQDKENKWLLKSLMSQVLFGPNLFPNMVVAELLHWGAPPMLVLTVVALLQLPELAALEARCFVM